MKIFGLQGLGQRPPGTVAHDLVDQRPGAAAAAVVWSSPSLAPRRYGSYLPDRRWRADLA
jgi:hypothetical protein